MLNRRAFKRVTQLYDRNATKFGRTRRALDEPTRDYCCGHMPVPIRYDPLLAILEGLDMIYGDSLAGHSFLDFGSLSGRTCALINVTLGLNTIGIEWIKQFVEHSNRMFGKVEGIGLLGDRTCRAYHGNFFPPRFEDGSKLGLCDDSHDVYEEIGTPLSGFRVVHVYQYDDNTPVLFQLIGEECSPGTIVIDAYGLPLTKQPYLTDNFTLIKRIGSSHNILEVK